MHRVVASVAYVGFVPRRLWGTDSGAGTFGAAVAWLGSWLLWPASWWVHVLVFAAAAVLSLWSAAPFADAEGDPGWVCIDEVAGTLVAAVGLAGWPWLVAVAVARLADIFKVLPGVRAAESLHGAVGVTLDDVVAGLYGLGAGWLTWWLLS